MWQGFEEFANANIIYTGNVAIDRVFGKAKFLLKLISKILVLNNVLHVLFMYINLIFDTLLNKDKLEINFEANKIIITYSENYG